MTRLPFLFSNSKEEYQLQDLGLFSSSHRQSSPSLPSGMLANIQLACSRGDAFYSLDFAIYPDVNELDLNDSKLSIWHWSVFSISELFRVGFL